MTAALPGRRSPEHQRAVQELRRGNATVPKPPRRPRRQGSRSAARRKAVTEGSQA